jgi:hypothetical protein
MNQDDENVLLAMKAHDCDSYTAIQNGFAENIRILRENARMQHEHKEYQRQRAQEYPPITNQLDTLYHGGYDAWKASIDAVKLKYPKPE